VREGYLLERTVIQDAPPRIFFLLDRANVRGAKRVTRWSRSSSPGISPPSLDVTPGFDPHFTVSLGVSCGTGDGPGLRSNGTSTTQPPNLS